MRAEMKQTWTERELRYNGAVRALAGLVLGCVGVLVLAGPALAGPRDRDGSRMQARQVKAGQAVKDRLKAPRDKADWRYIEVAGSKKLMISVGVEGSAAVTVRVLDASGKELIKRTTQGGRLALVKPVAAGMYYIYVGLSEGSAEYTLSCALK